MIRFANSKDMPAIKKLWHSAFGDDESYIDFYLDNCFDKNQCLLFVENRQICSMLFLIDCTIGKYVGKYIYAACTDEGFRNRGYMGQLLNFVNSNLGTIYDFVCLTPANDSLFNYYSKFGYKKHFYNSVTEIENTNTCTITPCKDISFDEFEKLRDNFYSDSILKWGINALEYAFKENLFAGGRNVKIPGGYAIINEKNNICNVLEWTSKDFRPSYFTQITKCGKIVIREFANGDVRCNGMILTNLDIRNGKFLSLVLD